MHYANETSSVLHYSDWKQHIHTQRKYFIIKWKLQQQEVYANQANHNMAHACNLGMMQALENMFIFHF